MKAFTLLCGALALIFAGCTRSESDPAKAAAAGPKPLIVGMELSYPPFEMIDGQGQPCGVGVEMAQALAVYLKRPIQIENIPFDGLILALKGGRVDIVISSMTATPERAQSIDFSDPYVRTGLGLLVPANEKANSIGELDQPGKRIAVKRGTTAHIYAAEQVKRAQILIFDKDSVAAMEVAQGKADAFMYDQISVYQHWQKHPDTTRAILAPVQMESWAVALRKGDDALRVQVNAFLKEYRQQGGFDRLGTKYLKELKEAFQKQGIEFVF